MRHRFDQALEEYNRCVEMRSAGRQYFVSAALLGCVRAIYGSGAPATRVALPTRLKEAENIATEYEYNDHLAFLKLVVGHLAWEDHQSETAFNAYQHALIYALRFNRFVLDEVLWGGDGTTLISPLIEHCLNKGEPGRNMLKRLRDWWQIGTNDTGSQRIDTISPVAEGISLLQAEKIARKREPGDFVRQLPVVERIEVALDRRFSNDSH